MTYAKPAFDDLSATLPPLPSWITSGRGDSAEDLALMLGGALAHLQLVLDREAVPQALLRARLALRAAEACVVFSGRPERAAALRDALCLLRPGDQPGPAGQIYQSWQRAGERPVSVKALHRALPEHPPEQIARWLDAGTGGPLTRVPEVMGAVLAEAPRAEVAAPILADAALARALGWNHLVPLLATGIAYRHLRAPGRTLATACARALIASAIAAVREAQELLRRGAGLRAVAPKLRAKGAAEAVQMFLSGRGRAFGAALPDRAARRLCDRLVTLGAVRELTGRDSFRLYGV